MCGKESELLRTSIENTILNVCRNCAKYGKILGPVKRPEARARPRKLEEKEVVQIIIPGYGKAVKNARESMGLTHEEFANRISEKSSIIHKIETESIEPSLALAQKLERFLKIRLIEEYEEDLQPKQQAKPDTFTLGDFIKVKKK